MNRDRETTIRWEEGLQERAVSRDSRNTKEESEPKVAKCTQRLKRIRTEKRLALSVLGEM